jgi:hypothetical protein
MVLFYMLLVETWFCLEVCRVDELLEPKKEDDCCMTATTGKVVYVVGKQKPEADKQPKADAKRIAEAVARTAKYVKK